MPSSTVKIFGERNTGTNALMQIIEANSAAHCLPGTEKALHPLAAEVVNHRWTPLSRRAVEYLIDKMFGNPSPMDAWKHCATNFGDIPAFEEALVLFTVRHPASWVLSLFKRPYHQLGRTTTDLATFISTPWKTARRERLGGASFLPLELYEMKVRSYHELASRLDRRGIPHAFVRHEDIILHQKDVFSRLARHLAAPSEQFAELRQGTKYPYTTTLEDFRGYYGEERWRAELQPVSAEINSQINWNEFAEFGYRKLDE